MARNRSPAPVQTDPIRERLGIRAVVRDVRCPNCDVLFATARRWQMRCPECDYRWTDRSSRTIIDDLRDARLNVFGTLVFATAILVAVGFLAFIIIWLVVEAADVWGWEGTYGIAAFLIACVLSLVVLAALFRHE